MPRITATLNEGFVAHIDYTAFDDTVDDLRIICPVSGVDLTPLVAYSSTAWDQAWSAAERDVLRQPRKADMRAMTYDTPYAYGVAA